MLEDELDGDDEPESKGCHSLFIFLIIALFGLSSSISALFIKDELGIDNGVKTPYLGFVKFLVVVEVFIEVLSICTACSSLESIRSIHCLNSTVDFIVSSFIIWGLNRAEDDNLVIDDYALTRLKNLNIASMALDVLGIPLMVFIESCF
uniref:Uncharacterized protein n=1 Tax=Aplanochytrium stocchinoi TaxID=215587 RepID=A0A7S3LN15_9STRA|mmetsp:Transcript_9317/g.10613  ORF Transcript_9317/g.10613 Transcript_9317/m.10613 type:complete len:149 (+) Transcript_9317:58-504(+)|eukprot:CAMPEP_0204853726 /NCGR_PEP_ID=MMETSP1347-20130617/13946_1 /ASSEMBLY_ACC=CAM_ASM_000690 /TAXON_ID=215587 /ORGANISM="Aplanochytrium stocchinoi, Strain GSBS06" /LENGTH=148 /DNA_ID=CAMNT_0051998871 /DNA_START=38 /DNA_END=484 /DNA_ORIENTATION=-